MVRQPPAYQSYYGAALCCCWSPDAKYIGVGGEDDLVAMYCVADKQVVAWGEGHSSWVSRVAFDPWVKEESMLPADVAGGQGAGRHSYMWIAVKDVQMNWA